MRVKGILFIIMKMGQVGILQIQKKILYQESSFIIQVVLKIGIIM